MFSFLRNYPLSTGITAVVTLVGATAGVTEYFHSQRVHALREERDSIIGRLESDAVASSTRLQGQIDDLKRQLVSVERVIGGGDGPSKSFDLSRALIDEADAPKYRNGFSWMASNQFGVSLPEYFPWKLSETNELIRRAINTSNDIDDLDSLDEKTVDFHTWSSEINSIVEAEISDDLPDSAVVRILDAYKKEKVWIWHPDLMNIVPIYVGESPVLYYNLCPYVSVSIIDSEYYRRLISVIQPEVIDFSKNMMKSLLDIDAESIDNMEITEGDKEDMLSVFEDVQLVITMLIQYFQEKTIMRAAELKAAGVDWRVNIRSFQKKANLTYLSSQERFKNALLSGNGSLVDLVIDEEIFFVGRQNDVVMITTFVPYLDQHDTDYAETQTWFDGLRISMKSESPTRNSC